MEFNFISVNEPSEELIEEFHMGMARDLITNFGAETMREVIRVYEEMNKLDNKAE